jgi:hypothetical protein
LAATIVLAISAPSTFFAGAWLNAVPWLNAAFAQKLRGLRCARLLAEVEHRAEVEWRPAIRPEDVVEDNI